MLKEKFVGYIDESIRTNWSLTALSDYNGESFTYSQVGSYILKWHTYFQNSGIIKGNKIALVGKNSVRWCVIYLAVTSYGATVVPILPDFKPDDIQSIVNHSDSVLLFCADSIYATLDPDAMPAISNVISLNTFAPLEKDGKKELSKNFPVGDPSGNLSQASFKLPDIENDALAVISYTSGTTGFSKGVMLPHNSLAANIRFAQNNMPLKAGDAIVSFLPLAHTYGCAFEFLFPFSIGCHVTILTKTPSPQIVMQAFREIKPALILSVPLVIEKIYKKQVIPVISKTSVRFLMKIPLINRLLYNKIRKKLEMAFGGNFTEIIIGGAPFNPEAETFFKKIGLRFTVGYGMTECGPLISYLSSSEIKAGSSGRSVDTLEVKIDSSEPEKITGEIMVKGENVMLGYYKNENATKQIIDGKGWLHTGDLGLIDKDGNIYIKGRSKSLILGANGKNIYPEELEAMIDNKYGVGESIVVQRNDKLIALIYPDQDILMQDQLSHETLKEIFTGHIRDINSKVPAYMNITRAEIHAAEFEKTPKRSVKRFLYQ